MVKQNWKQNENVPKTIGASDSFTDHLVTKSECAQIHLENMLKLARMGVSIAPPMMAFYNHPEKIEDMVDHIVMRVLDQFDITVDTVPRWDGKMKLQKKTS